MNTIYHRLRDRNRCQSKAVAGRAWPKTNTQSMLRCPALQITIATVCATLWKMSADCSTVDEIIFQFQIYFLGFHQSLTHTIVRDSIIYMRIFVYRKC